ncbi:MAG: phage tail protein [Helicobacteraceae bacterium]|jgi:phage protein U|nr:phage tail protein [Helicobacteraceae bacterium]
MNMLISLGEVELNIWEVEAIAQKIEAQWAEFDRIGRSPKHFAVGGAKESIDFEAILQNSETYQELEAIVKAKKPVFLTFQDGSAIRVIVLSCELTRSYFNGRGKAIREIVKISLAVYNG